MTASGAAARSDNDHNVVVLNVPSALIAARQSVPIPPAALSVLWHIAHAMKAPQV